jgi:hypothetical protein
MSIHSAKFFQFRKLFVPCVHVDCYFLFFLIGFVKREKSMPISSSRLRFSAGNLSSNPFLFCRETHDDKAPFFCPVPKCFNSVNFDSHSSSSNSRKAEASLYLMLSNSRICLSDSVFAYAIAGKLTIATNSCYEGNYACFLVELSHFAKSAHPWMYSHRRVSHVYSKQRQQTQQQ